MIARKFLAYLVLFAAGNFLCLKGVVKENDLLLRWSFDEGSGSNSQNLVGVGLEAILEQGSKWGVESNGTAKSGHSLDLSSGNGLATALNDTRLQASDHFTYMFWFKSNGVPNDYSLLLSKRSGIYSSYFVQVDPGGSSLKTILRKYGVYYDTGPISFNPNQWHPS